MARWCPNCGSEYVDGKATCSECDVPLQAVRPPRRGRSAPSFTPDDAIFIEPRAARGYSDPFIPIWEGAYEEGVHLIRRLEDASVPVETAEAAEAGRLRVQVPRSYIEEAYAVLDRPDVAASDVSFEVPDDPSALFESGAEEGDEGEPANNRLLSVVLAVVAVILVVVLIVT
ncbi:MAG TPA: hypothetical protein VM840_11560 [Actinomycetota bacterium]|nr:hypothetical protein [Actinomycetota bacterium]